MAFLLLHCLFSSRVSKLAEGWNEWRERREKWIRVEGVEGEEAVDKGGRKDRGGTRRDYGGRMGGRGR